MNDNLSFKNVSFESFSMIVFVIHEVIPLISFCCYMSKMGVLHKAAFAGVSGEESHRNATSVKDTKPTATAFVAKTFDNKRRFNSNNIRGSDSNSNFNNRGPNPNMKCTNFNKIGHTIDRCFELVGYPGSYVKKNFNANIILVSSNNASVDVHSNHVTSNNVTASNSHVSLSNEQLARFMSLLNDNGVSTGNANMSILLVLYLLIVSTKNVMGLEDGSKWLLGWANRRDLVLNQVMMMVSCTNKDKLLVLSWGRNPRLDFGVRVSVLLVFLRPPCLSFLDVPLLLLGGTWVTWSLRGLLPSD
ncbi:hypothetical protein Tco_0695066 [Tanacetum coccineum]